MLRSSAAKASGSISGSVQSFPLGHCGIMTPPGAFFFFQAEDGIRDGTVTGVQTCALPIYPENVAGVLYPRRFRPIDGGRVRRQHFLDRGLCSDRVLAGGRRLHTVSRCQAASKIGRASCREIVEFSAGCLLSKGIRVETVTQ